MSKLKHTQQTDCVHTEHCCRIHGCKYGQEDSCPVWLGYKAQNYVCEYCYDSVYDEDYEPLGLDSVPKVSDKEFRKRRLESDHTQYF